nr:MAG TPA: nucelotide kinase [Caudoviricetes sp.]
MNTLDTQIGGTHYTDLPHQPLDLIAGLNLDFFQGNVVKYLTRYKFKGAPVADLKKAADYCRKAHAYLDYKAVTDDYRTRATYAVEMHCEANGASEKVREAMLKAILYQWREAANLIDELVADSTLEDIDEERRCNSVGVGDFYAAADGDLALGAPWGIGGQYRIHDEGGQYAVLHVENGGKILKGRYPTIDEAKEGVIYHREARLDLLVRVLSDDLERSRKKHPIK